MINETSSIEDLQLFPWGIFFFFEDKEYNNIKFATKNSGCWMTYLTHEVQPTIFLRTLHSDSMHLAPALNLKESRLSHDHITLILTLLELNN